MIPSNVFWYNNLDKDSAPTSTNATVQVWLDKIAADGYVYPSQAQVDVYTTAWEQITSL